MGGFKYNLIVISKASLELMIPLPQSPGCCDYRSSTPYLSRCSYSYISIYRCNAMCKCVWLFILIYTCIKLCVNCNIFIYTCFFFYSVCVCVCVCVCACACARARSCAHTHFMPQGVCGRQGRTLWSPSILSHGSLGSNAFIRFVQQTLSCRASSPAYRQTSFLRFKTL